MTSPVSIRINKDFKWLKLKCDMPLHIGIVNLSPTYFHSENIGLIRVPSTKLPPLSVLGLRDVLSV